MAMGGGTGPVSLQPPHPRDRPSWANSGLAAPGQQHTLFSPGGDSGAVTACRVGNEPWVLPLPRKWSLTKASNIHSNLFGVCS